jgi:hypothetical protein
MSETGPGHAGHDKSRSASRVAVQKHDSHSAKRLASFLLTTTAFACIVTFFGKSADNYYQQLPRRIYMQTVFHYSILDSLFAVCGYPE